jgi:hypothetical protein
LVLLAAQLGVITRMLLARGLDGPGTGFLLVMMTTALSARHNRRLADEIPGQSRSVRRWIIGSRVGALALLTAATIVVAFHRYLPDPGPEVVLRLLTVLMWLMIVAKGAVIGKLRPGRFLGLRVHWTLTSRLAWDRAHQALGRIELWGGLVGLAAAFTVHPRTSVLAWATLLTLAVAVALIEARQTWRIDPERHAPEGAT